MRFFTAAFLFLTLALGASAADVTFVRVWPAWRATDSFERISEFFSGQEKTDSHILLRTQADERSGYYFLVRVRNPGATLAATKFTLFIVTPDSPEPKKFEFISELPANDSVFNLGLTGTDWPGQQVRPVAWKLSLATEKDEPLATSQSFLWAKPDGQAH